MTTLPQLPSSSNPTPRPRDLRSWIDLIAFLAILATVGAVLVFGHPVAGSLATICVALSSLYAEWRRTRSRHEASSSDEHDEKSGEDHH